MRCCEAETSHLPRRTREEEQPSVPESVSPFTFNGRKIGNPDNRPENDSMWYHRHSISSYMMHSICTAPFLCWEEGVRGLSVGGSDLSFHFQLAVITH